MDSRICIPLVSGAGLLDMALAAMPTPLPTTRTVPTVASAARPTADAVTLTVVAATETTVQPGNNAKMASGQAAPAIVRDTAVCMAAAGVITEPACPAQRQARG